MPPVRTDGKQFSVGDTPFRFRGVTYGTFARRADGATYPERDRVKLDFAAMAEAGFSVVRTYEPPPTDVIELAADAGLRLLAGVFASDWRYLLGSSHRQRRRVAADARAAARAAARRLAGSEEVLALTVGNEVPADVVRWVGARVVARLLEELAEVVREEDPQRLVSYANYPTAEYLALEGLDFLTFNVFLEGREEFRRYLTRLQHLAGDRPLVLGEIGWHAGPGREGERRQAEVLDWQLATAIERGVAGTCVFSWTDDWAVADVPVTGWRFGLTRLDRSPRPALSVAARWNDRTVRDLDRDWPPMSVVVCAYNAAATLDECLAATCAIDYPGLDILVVDDGSTDATASIARRHPEARLLTIPHGGLSVARNEGFRAARGEIVAYLDSDAYPTPDWPWYLALGCDEAGVAGSGGPNIPPPGDPVGAQQVARAPGGPVHVLLGDDRAEHLPGCNMAFRRAVLEEIGGFDPVYEAAGDDVDLCWRVLDRGLELGFHPAALVWHHRRSGLRSYLRQQRGYGRAEALLEARHPDRFTAAGTARWKGRVYHCLSPAAGRARVYRGPFGTAAYQSVYRGGGHALSLVHQLGMPLAALLATTAPLGLLSRVLYLPALVGVILAASLAGIDMFRVRLSPPMSKPGARFRLGVAVLELLQPLARTWGRVRHRAVIRRGVPAPPRLPGPARRAPGGVLVFPADLARAELAASVIAHLRRGGLRVVLGGPWEDHDARLIGSTLVLGRLVTSDHPAGSTQLLVRRRLRLGPAVALGALAVLAAAGRVAGLGPALLVIAIAEGGRGLWRTGGLVRRVVRNGSEGVTRHSR